MTYRSSRDADASLPRAIVYWIVAGTKHSEPVIKSQLIMARDSSYEGSFALKLVQESKISPDDIYVYRRMGVAQLDFVAEPGSEE